MYKAIARDLTTKAFAMQGGDEFAVSANLKVSTPESLQAFETFERMLMMAYYAGQHSVLDSGIKLPLPSPEGYR